MTSIAEFLTRDHEHCDALFAEAENAVADGDWGLAAEHFEAFRAAALLHFRREEAVLFPDFEAHTGMRQGPTVVMRSEHDHMREGLDAMAEALARRDANAFLGQSETMLMLMRQHNMKEEQVLYPMADRALAAQQARIVQAMAQADRPGGESSHD